MCQLLELLYALGLVLNPGHVLEIPGNLVKIPITRLQMRPMVKSWGLSAGLLQDSQGDSNGQPRLRIASLRKYGTVADSFNRWPSKCPKEETYTNPGSEKCREQSSDCGSLLSVVKSIYLTQE